MAAAGRASEFAASFGTLLETEYWPMIRTVVVAGALLLGVGAVLAQQDVAVKQDNLMRAQGKSMYVVISKTVKGETPYDQKAIDAAIAQLEESVPTIPTVFATNPNERDLWIVAEDLAEQGRFRFQGTARLQSDRGRQGQDQGCRQPEDRFRLDPGEVHRLSRDLSAKAQVGNSIAAAQVPNSNAKGWIAAGRSTLFLFSTSLHLLKRRRRNKPNGRSYFVTWPRISPPGLAAVWTLT
jgi:hypothetical protein